MNTYTELHCWLIEDEESTDISDSNTILKLVTFGLALSGLTSLHQVWKLIYLCHVIWKNFLTALLSLHKTCLDRLIWSRCFKDSLKMLSARSYLEQRRKHYIVRNILPFVHGLCRGLHLLYWDEKMSVLPDLHSNGLAPILMKKQVFLGREVSKLTDFFLYFSLLPLSPPILSLLSPSTLSLFLSFYIEGYLTTRGIL